MRETEQLILQNYARLALDLLPPLLNVLHAARNACAGDLDKYLILLAICVRTAEQGEFVALAQDRMDCGEAPVVPGLGTNMSSVAHSLEIPKETVRRKVQELIETGWIAREGKLLFPTARAYDELALLRIASAKQAARHHEVVARLLSGG